MAKTNTSDRVKAAGNPFSGMTIAAMKKKWSSMTPAQRKANESNFISAAKSAPKAKPKAAAKPASKPKAKPKAPSTNHPIMAGGKGGKYDRTAGTRGSNVPNNPKLKSQSRKPSTGHNIMSSSSSYTGDNLKVKKVKARGVGVKGRSPVKPPTSTRRKTDRRGRPLK